MMDTSGPKPLGRRPAGALGRAGGAGGEHDGPAVALGRVQRRPASAAATSSSRRAFVEPGQLGGEAEDPLGELVVVHEEPQPLLLGDGAQLGGGRARC